VRRAHVLWRRCGEGVSLLVLAEDHGEAGAVPASPCHDSKAVYLAALLLEEHTPIQGFASPAVFGSGASLPRDVSSAPVPATLAAALLQRLALSTAKALQNKSRDERFTARLGG